MVPRRAALALSVLLLLASLSAGLVPARAQTVGEAEERADAARAESDRAYGVVTNAVANKDAVEAQLFEALTTYEAAVSELAAANQRLERVSRALASAEAGAAAVSDALQSQAVSAYMDAVANPLSSVIAHGGVEQAMIYDQAVGEDQAAEYEQLNGLTAQRAELDRLRADFAAERDEVEALEAELADQTANLEALFSEASDEVARAYQQAAAADAAYQAALSDVDRARAAEEERRRQQATSTTSTPATTSPPPTSSTSTDQPGTTTTTTPTEPQPRPPLKPAVERWRSLVAAYFSPDLVEDALYIIQCESIGDPEAVNPYSGASGLFQFLPGTWAVASVNAGVGEASVFDPEANIAAAAWLVGYYEANGKPPWAAWACRWYLT